MRAKKGWKVKVLRPEELYKEPVKFYTAQEIERFSRSGSMKRIQQELTSRAIELGEFESGKILDLGCGAGFSLELLEKLGFDSVGVDIVKGMVEKARKKGFEVAEADMRELPFKDRTFDGVISISSFQWLLSEDSRERKKNVKAAAKEINRVLKPRAKAVIQFYPNSEEIMLEVGSAFAGAGLKGGFYIDNPDNPRKRRIFLVVQKE